MTARDAILAREAHRSPEGEAVREVGSRIASAVSGTRPIIHSTTVVETAPRDPYNLDSLTKPQLVEMAEAFGLDTSGTKADLIARLTDGPAQG